MPAAYAQTVSGEITGSVADPGGAVVAGGVVSLVSDLDKQTHEFVTNSSGEFLFTGHRPHGRTINLHYLEYTADNA